MTKVTGAIPALMASPPSQSTLSRPIGFDQGEGRYRVLSLFAGIGGFDLGLERTGGFKTVAVAELDAYASKVLALRFPDAPNVGDVTTAEYPDADIICAGFPCQDISFAGLGAGLAGERSGLWREVVRAIRLVRPRYAVLENVAALLGRGLDTVVGDLASIGYDAEWHCIPASAIGAPHRRDRIWIVANPSDARPPCSGWLAQRLGEIIKLGNGDSEDAAQVADAESERRGEAGQLRPDQSAQWTAGCGEVVADTRSSRLSITWPEPDGQDGQQGGRVPSASGWWAVEPDVGRVAHGIPKRVDRLRCLGNAVVPQIPELIGRAILAAEQEQRMAA